MTDVLLRLTALTYRPFSLEWFSNDEEEKCLERLESGVLVSRFVRISAYNGRPIDVPLGVVDPHLAFCGLTVAVLRPLSWGVSGPDAVRRFLPKLSIPGFRLAPTMQFSFGAIEGWFANA